MTGIQRSQDVAGVDADTFRDAMSRIAAPLTVVTTRDSAGRPWGFTASSVTAASLDPPLVLVGIGRTSSCLDALNGAPEFVINVLGQCHHHVARRFAAHGVDRFTGQDFSTWQDCGLPYLPDAHAALRCAATDRIPAGDHELLIGRLIDAITNSPSEPLLWYGRAFRALASPR